MKLEILIVLILTTLACSSIGSFLVLRKMSMLSDAISHTVLLGIIIAFFITRSLTSPLLLIFAALFGLITVIAVELLFKTKRVSEDASIGVIFPLFFSLSILLITRFADTIHIDKDTVLLGQIALVPLNRITVLNINIPFSMLVMIIIAIINIGYIWFFYKELKLTTFDEEYAMMSGFNKNIIQYSLMSLVSITSVASFDVVGAVLVISLMIAPAASAYIIAKDLKIMLLLSVMFGILASILGFAIAYPNDLSISGTISVMNGLIFFIVFSFHPHRGLIIKYFTHYQKKRLFEEDLLILHLKNHGDDFEEVGIPTIAKHLDWETTKLNKRTQQLIAQEKIYIENEMYHLTPKGEQYADKIRKAYFND